MTMEANDTIDALVGAMNTHKDDGEFTFNEAEEQKKPIKKRGNSPVSFGQINPLSLSKKNESAEELLGDSREHYRKGSLKHKIARVEESTKT